MDYNPCLSCGACCALFRASFYWSESSDFTPGGVPTELTLKVNDFLIAMKGTDRVPPRCVALIGEIGENVYCSIYPQRSSVCREFDFAWQNNRPNPRCGQARLAWGIKPLLPDSRFGKRRFSKAA